MTYQEDAALSGCERSMELAIDRARGQLIQLETQWRWYIRHKFADITKPVEPDIRERLVMRYPSIPRR